MSFETDSNAVGIDESYTQTPIDKKAKIEAILSVADFQKQYTHAFEMMIPNIINVVKINNAPVTNEQIQKITSIIRNKQKT